MYESLAIFGTINKCILLSLELFFNISYSFINSFIVNKYLKFILLSIAILTLFVLFLFFNFCLKLLNSSVAIFALLTTHILFASSKSGSSNICSLCGKFKGEDDSFLIHLIQFHKKQVIDQFKKKQKKFVQKVPNTTRGQKIIITDEQKQFKVDIDIKTSPNNKSPLDKKRKDELREKKLDNNSREDAKISKDILMNQKNEKYLIDKKNPELKGKETELKSTKKQPTKDSKSKNEFNSIKNPLFNLNENTNDLVPSDKRNENKENLVPSDKRNENKINLVPDKKNENKENLVYCDKINEKIKGEHKCEIGICLCVNCMAINIEKSKSEKGKLILKNKKGHYSTYNSDKNKFYCNQIYKGIIKNEMGKCLPSRLYCDPNSGSCDDCKVLNKFMKEYLKGVNSNIIK